MKFKIRLYPNQQGSEREEKIEADTMEETSHGNIKFKANDGTVLGFAARGAFELITKV